MIGEFCSKLAYSLPKPGRIGTAIRREIAKFLLISLLAGNEDAETGSIATASRHHAVSRKQRFPGCCRIAPAPAPGTLVSAAQNRVSRGRDLCWWRLGSNAVSVGWKAEHLALPRWHSAGKSVRRAMPMPYGSRRLMAALTRSGCEESERNRHVDLPAATSLTLCDAVGC